MGKRSWHKFEPSKLDLHPTPLAAVEPLIPHLRAEGLREFSEPCCGPGDLVRHLEGFGLVCTYRGDISTDHGEFGGKDALDIQSFDAMPVTNPPHSWVLLQPLLDHFLELGLEFWFLLSLDWASNKYAAPYMRYCTDIVTIFPRVKWKANTKHHAKDNFAWMHFDADHRGPTIFHHALLTPPKMVICAAPDCGRPFVPERNTARYCGSTCRQRAHRAAA